MLISQLIKDSINVCAVEYGLEGSVLKAIIRQESSFNIYALRYEPEWKYLLNPIHYADALGISVVTETQTQKMSWGLGQIMGSELRNLGFVGQMGEVFHPPTNIKYIGLYVKKWLDKTKPPEEIFACYNGGPGAVLKKEKEGKYSDPVQVYIDSCMKYYEEYRRE